MLRSMLPPTPTSPLFSRRRLFCSLWLCTSCLRYQILPQVTPNSAVDSRQQDGHPPCPCVIRYASEAKTGESVNRSLIKAQSDVEGEGFVGEDETAGRSGQPFRLTIEATGYRLCYCQVHEFTKTAHILGSFVSFRFSCSELFIL